MAKKLAVLVSGSGTILEAMIKGGLPIALVLADRHCRGLEIAKEAGIETVLVDRREFGYAPGQKWTNKAERANFSRACARELQIRGIDEIAMAGFMTLFSGPMFEAYADHILNTHPSYLPDFPGEHAVRDALAAGVEETGCTIHIAIEEVDAGPIIAQKHVPILEGDTEETLHERIKVVERQLYPATIRERLAA